MSRPVPIDILVCPECSNGLSSDGGGARCRACGSRFGRRGRSLCFAAFDESDIADPFDRLKYLLKRHPALYSFLNFIIGPVNSNRSVLRPFLEEHVAGGDVAAVNLGSGNTDISPFVSNIDIFPYDNVDLACTIDFLPIRDESVDVVLSVAALEHVPEPETVVAEMHRILKPGGVLYVMMPFIQGFHASPHDYSRRTSAGLRRLMRNFEETGLHVASGPTSGLLWVLQEWAAILCSFGSRRLYFPLHMIFMVATFPLKFLDIFLRHHPMAENIASGFIFTGRKSPG